MPLEITDNIDALIAVMPPEIAASLKKADRMADLLEIVIDKGRPCDARYVDGDVRILDREATDNEIQYVVDHIGNFGDDNRAGIERTLHRISAIRNRTGKIIGLTCRVGRAVYGTIDIIEDIIFEGKSVLLLGRPGVGKTTMLREVARVLAEKRRVVIVDTSNEIGGDGDIPHSAIGNARRMQVPHPSKQHEVMIEAVENHMPEVIVIDEIGTESEAAAARTIAERGVQLIGTAHGNTLDNLMMNPTLSDLIGGIQPVTLGDEEARRRGTQKTILERKAPPTFDVVVEIQSWDQVVVHPDVATSIDSLLRGKPVAVENRHRTEKGIETVRDEAESEPAFADETIPFSDVTPLREWQQRGGHPKPLKIFPYGLNQDRIRQASQQLGLPIVIVTDLSQADVLFTLRTYYRKRPRAIADAERRNLPVYVLRNNTATQMEKYLSDIFGLQKTASLEGDALKEVRQAIEDIQLGKVESVQLSPQSAYIRRLQHEMISEAQLASHSSGNEPRRRVTVYAGQ